MTRVKAYYCGIIDSYGLESFMPFTAEHLNLLELRARFNPHNISKIYTILISEREADSIKKEMTSIVLKGVSKNVSIQQSKRWKRLASKIQKIKTFKYVNI